MFQAGRVVARDLREEMPKMGENIAMSASYGLTRLSLIGLGLGALLAVGFAEAPPPPADTGASGETGGVDSGSTDGGADAGADGAPGDTSEPLEGDTAEADACDTGCEPTGRVSGSDLSAEKGGFGCGHLVGVSPVLGILLSAWALTLRLRRD